MINIVLKLCAIWTLWKTVDLMSIGVYDDAEMWLNISILLLILKPATRCLFKKKGASHENN